MFKKKYFFLLAAIMFSLVAFSCSSDSSGLKLSPSSLSFDKVNIGDLVTIDLVIENKYGKDVVISALDLVGHTDFTISAGLSLPYTLVDKTQVTITISYEPTVAGAQEAVLSIVHDGSTKPKDVKIAGEGVPVPRIRLSETTYDFGMSLISGSGVTHIFDIENIGTADMNITGLGFSGTNASSYSIVSGGNVPIAVTPGTKHQVEVKFFSPNVGIETATLEIAHDAVNEASPSTISLSADSVDRQGEIDLSVSNPWSFGAMPTGWTVVQPFEIENIGVAVLKVTSLTLQTGTDFSIVDVVDSNDVSVNLPVDLQIGDKIFVKVQFIAPGTSNYNDTLEIIHDGTNVSSPLDLKIEASGKTPTSKSFSYQGSVENWTVPAGVYLIKVTANGAGGGGTTGGKGGQIVAYAAVTPGDTLNIVVGGKGNNYVSEDRSANGGGGFSGVLDNANNHLVTAGGAGGTAGTDGSPYGAGGDGGGGNGGNGGCGQGGAGGINGPSPTGGVGGISGGNAGLPGTSVGGGNGGNGISNQASGGGGGGYGTGKGIGGTQYSVSGKGGDGGFGGGGGGGGGGWGSTNSRRSGGGGGGGGYAGGAGGTAPSGCSGSGGGGGGGGSNYADPAKATILTDTKGGGAARGTNGSVTIEY